jgi:hypothetical protein
MHFFKSLILASALALGVQAMVLPLIPRADSVEEPDDGCGCEQSWRTVKRAEVDEAWKIAKRDAAVEVDEAWVS